MAQRAKDVLEPLLVGCSESVCIASSRARGAAPGDPQKKRGGNITWAIRAQGAKTPGRGLPA
eukprot:5140074-Pyramimonas_sp.AAC.1